MNSDNFFLLFSNFDVFHPLGLYDDTSSDLFLDMFLFSLKILLIGIPRRPRLKALFPQRGLAYVFCQFPGSPIHLEVTLNSIST